MKMVLVIEDKDIVRDAIQDWLEEEGFRVVGAASGALGIQLAQEQVPDLILCDILMPDTDGYAVLADVRQNPVTAAIPFIFLSVKGTRADVRYGMDLGADDYLTKPCTAKELINAVTSRLDKQARLQAQSQQQLEILRNSIAFSLPHEFRTPLTGILTGADLLRVLANNPREVLEIASAIRESGERLYSLVKKFLLYVELEMIARNPERLQELQVSTPWNPVEIIQTMAFRVANRYNRASDLQINLEEVKIFLSEERLIRVIEELVDNACKFSNTNTRIQLSGVLNFSMNETRHYIINVVNQSQGLTSEQLSAIGAYVQFNRNQNEQQGTGLGLSIARRIIELHGGRLTVSSVLNGAINIQVALPATEP
jgi:DNA-binding response OmpR family regulator